MKNLSGKPENRKKKKKRSGASHVSYLAHYLGLFDSIELKTFTSLSYFTYQLYLQIQNTEGADIAPLGFGGQVL